MYRPLISISQMMLSALMAAVGASTENTLTRAASYRQGPGKRTVFTLHKGINRSRYSGADLRELRAERGIGRPPAKLRKWS